MACIAVIGLHTSSKDVSVLNTLMYYFCGFAVPLFFMASGYILMQRTEITKSYVRKKYKQIFSVILSWGIIGSLIVLIYGVVHNHAPYVIVYDVIKICIGGVLQKGVYWQFWFFGAILLVYAITPFISGLTIKQKTIIWVLCFCCGELLQLFSIYVGSPLQKNIIQTFRIWSWVQYFLLGGFMHTIRKYFTTVRTYIHMLMMILWTIALLTYELYMGVYVLNGNMEGAQYAEFFYDSCFEIIWLILIFSFFMKVNLSQKTKKYVSIFTPFVMGIYIVHPLILRIINHFWRVEVPMDALYLFLGVLFVTLNVVVFMIKIPYLNKLIRL